jgi:hypothetical protein
MPVDVEVKEVNSFFVTADVSEISNCEDGHDREDDVNLVVFARNGETSREARGERRHSCCQREITA